MGSQRRIRLRYVQAAMSAPTQTRMTIAMTATYGKRSDDPESSLRGTFGFVPEETTGRL